MNIRPLRNESDYDWALREIGTYFEHEPRRGTQEAARFDVLAALIDSYESKHWPIDPPDPVEAIRYRMTQAGFSQADLARLVGSRSRASEILSRKRPLTMEQAWKLHKEWQIPADSLLQPYRTALSRG